MRAMLDRNELMNHTNAYQFGLLQAAGFNNFVGASGKTLQRK
jgi:hypothetical protein